MGCRNADDYSVAHLLNVFCVTADPAAFRSNSLTGTFQVFAICNIILLIFVE